MTFDILITLRRIGLGLLGAVIVIAIAEIQRVGALSAVLAINWDQQLVPGVVGMLAGLLTDIDAFKTAKKAGGED